MVLCVVRGELRFKREQNNVCQLCGNQPEFYWPVEISPDPHN